MTLEIGDKAPDFTLAGDDSHQHSLYKQKDRYMVLYFYPKDMTPGCTTESCEFNDNFDDFSDLGVRIFGISKDDLPSHNRFKSKYGLRFTLLSDPQLAVHKLYDAYGEKVLYGKTSMGVIRSTYLLDAQKNIIKKWRKLRVQDHALAVLEAVKKHEAKHN